MRSFACVPCVLPFLPFQRCAGLQRHHRQRENQFVLDHGGEIDLSIRDQQRLVSRRQRRLFALLADEAEALVDVDRLPVDLERPLTGQRQIGIDAHREPGDAERVLAEFEIVIRLALEIREAPAQTLERRERQLALEGAPRLHHARRIHAFGQGGRHGRAMVGFGPFPVNRSGHFRPIGSDRQVKVQSGLLPYINTRQTTETEVGRLIYLIGTLAAAVVLLAGFVLRERRLRRRPTLLAAVMDEADALERELYECRARLREIPALVAALPPSAQLSARATLVAEPQVQAALRDLLSHRLWLKENATTATFAELESAHEALSAAKAALAAQLGRLAEVRAELESARAAQAERDATPP